MSNNKIATVAMPSTKIEKSDYLGALTLFGSLSTSTKKMRSAKKRERQNRKRGRR